MKNIMLDTINALAAKAARLAAQCGKEPNASTAGLRFLAWQLEAAGYLDGRDPRDDNRGIWRAEVTPALGPTLVLYVRAETLCGAADMAKRVLGIGPSQFVKARESAGLHSWRPAGTKCRIVAAGGVYTEATSVQALQIQGGWWVGLAKDLESALREVAAQAGVDYDSESHLTPQQDPVRQILESVPAAALRKIVEAAELFMAAKAQASPDAIRRVVQADPSSNAARYLAQLIAAGIDAAPKLVAHAA